MTLRVEPRVIRGDAYLYDLADELNIPGEFTLSGRALRWVLHSIRNQVEKNISYKILSHLPPYLRLLYVDNWDVAEDHAHLDDTIILELREMWENNPAGSNPRLAGKAVIKAVFRVMGKKISYKDFEEIYNYLPEKYKHLLIEDAFPKQKV